MKLPCSRHGILFGLTHIIWIAPTEKDVATDTTPRAIAPNVTFDELLRRIQDIRTSERRFGAPTARCHPSLGQRPRFTSSKWNKGQRPGPSPGDSVCRVMSHYGDGTGFQPSVLFGHLFLGRCPRLGWERTFGAGAGAWRATSSTTPGKISHQMAKELAEAEYEKYNFQRIRQADAAGGEFEKAIKKLPPPPTPKKKGGKK